MTGTDQAFADVLTATLAEFEDRAARTVRESAEYIQREVSQAMQEVARLHLPVVQWTRVSVVGSSVPGYLAELVAPGEVR